jgi:hypothetical protein
MGSAADKRSAAPGQLRRHRALGRTSDYRVMRVEGPIVVMEAVDVPGLAPGDTVRLTREVVDAMEIVTASPSASKPSISDAA